MNICNSKSVLTSFSFLARRPTKKSYGHGCQRPHTTCICIRCTRWKPLGSCVFLTPCLSHLLKDRTRADGWNVFSGESPGYFLSSPQFCFQRMARITKGKINLHSILSGEHISTRWKPNEHVYQCNVAIDGGESKYNE